MTSVRHHTVQVPATSANLGPGFDAFGVALALHLVVRSVDRDSQRDRVRVVDDPATELTCGDENLIWRSLVAFCEHHAVPVPDVALITSSAIPLERGLGSSSSAIVAGLTLGRALTGVRCADPDLVSLAAQLEGHPDNVAPAVLGGLVACAADDDGQLVVRRITPSPGLRPVVLVPSDRQTTVTARAVLPEQLSAADVVLQVARGGHVLAGLLGAWPVAPEISGDRLHEPARREVMPATAALLRELRDGGVHAWLSGAGPSVAAAIAADGTQVPEQLVEAGMRHGFEALGTGFELSGAVACPDDGCALARTPTCVQCPRRRV